VFSNRNEIAGTFGVVASSHWIASQAGMAILEAGGNAFDAAVAAAFVMQVVEPHQNGIGGDAVIMLQSAADEAPQVLCGQGTAPAAATIGRYRSLGINIVPSTGLLSAVVPGAFDAWMLLLRDYGTRTLADVLSMAIDYACSGFPMTYEASKEIAKASKRFRSEWRSSASIYLPGNEVPAPGALFRNTILGKTYVDLLKQSMAASSDRCEQIEAARNIFYKGFIAEKIGNFFANPQDSNGEIMCPSGLLGANDMCNWAATYEKPISYDFEGIRVYKPGPWTQGLAFLQFLALLRHFNIREVDPLGSDYVHLTVECLKLAYADREAWYGDPNFVRVPIDDLLSDKYNSRRKNLITSEASLELRPGQPADEKPILPRFEVNVSGGASAEVAASDVRSRAKGDTCHIDVIDRWGNTVAATPSGGWLHGSPTIPGLGFSISTRAQMFWLQEGLPSSLIPGARPRTSLSPTIAVEKNGTTLAFGSRGGDYQDQWIAQFFLRHTCFAMDLQESADAPMFHSDHWPRSDYPRDATPGKLTMDERFSSNAINELRGRGHDVHIHPGRRWGRNCAAKKSGALLTAAASASVPQALAVGR
jgi:gamma-glutamyltranspeptidase/glutathione hydrolase